MHRVSEIKKSTDVSSWNYIPGVLNVADDAIHVTKFENLDEHCRWFNGPEFLVNDELIGQKIHLINQWRMHQLALTK